MVGRKAIEARPFRDTEARGVGKGAGFLLSGQAGLLVTSPQLKALAPGLRPLELASYTSLLHVALAEFGIDRPKRVTDFLAQTLHESQGYTRFEESFAYSPAGLVSIMARIGYPSRCPTIATASRLLQQGREVVAEAMYGSRPKLGNTAPGDGWKFRGRGVIQISGGFNYQRYGQRLGLDLVANPDQAALPGVAFRIAAAYWADHGCNQLADHEDFDGQTRAINGGLVGIDDRRARRRAARAVYGLEVAA